MTYFAEMKRWQLILICTGLLLSIIIIILQNNGLNTDTPVQGETVKLLLIPVALIFVGLAGQHTGMFYSRGAVIFANTILVLLFIEIVGIFLLLLPSDDVLDDRSEQSYYQEVDWGEQLWADFTPYSVTRYEPYTIWRQPEYDSETVNIDENGYRVTPGTECNMPDAYQVYVFGGSTVWGVGSPDWGTITAYLQDAYEQRLERPVCVRNLGELAYVVTQGVIELTRQLQQGNVPDVVIFYDGANDTFAAYQNDRAGLHHNVEQVRQRFEGTGLAGLRVALQTSHFVFYAASQFAEQNLQQDRTNRPQLSEVDPELVADLRDEYVNTYTLIQTLAEGYGFDAYFFWQPVISISQKSLSSEEEALIDETPVKLLFETVYAEFETTAMDYDNMHYIANVFDGTSEDSPIFVDWVHLTPIGNELVVEAMMNVITAPSSDET